MFVSTIIPTIGRQTLTNAVESVLNQILLEDEFEILVINDTGNPLPNYDWVNSEKVQIFDTNCRNRSIARNTGASIAKGRYFHFLDDDDWMLPGAFNYFWWLANNNDAAWLYGGFRVVNNAGELVAEINPVEKGNFFVNALASEWLPLQSSLILSDVFIKIGGFAPLNSLLGGYEDIDLLRQIARYYDIDGVPQVVVNIRAGDRSTTTDYTNMLSQNRISREKTLDLPDAYTRFRASAKVNKDNAAYWHGRIIYYYLASLKLNLQNKRFFSAASRGSYAIVGLICASKYLLSPRFWNGIVRPHYNQVRLTTDKLGFKWF